MKNQSFNAYFSLFVRSFLQGLVIIGPIGLTIFVVYSIFSSIDNMVPSVAKEIPGLVFISFILITALLGYLGNKFVFGKFIFDSIDSLLENTPGIKHIYVPTKEVMSSFMGDKKKLNDPVWVRVNQNPEMWRLGFLTQKDMSEVGKTNHVAVYLPHSYAISGWVIITDKDNVKPVVGMTSSAAMKFVVSGGVAGFHSEEKETNSKEENEYQP